MTRGDLEKHLRVLQDASEKHDLKLTELRQDVEALKRNRESAEYQTARDEATRALTRLIDRLGQDEVNALVSP